MPDLEIPPGAVVHIHVGGPPVPGAAWAAPADPSGLVVSGAGAHEPAERRLGLGRALAAAGFVAFGFCAGWLVNRPDGPALPSPVAEAAAPVRPSALPSPLDRPTSPPAAWRAWPEPPPTPMPAGAPAREPPSGFERALGAPPQVQPPPGAAPPSRAAAPGRNAFGLEVPGG